MHSPNEITNLSFKDIQDMKEMLNHAWSMIEIGDYREAQEDIAEVLNMIDEELDEE